jgi:antitoxin MazE
MKTQIIQIGNSKGIRLPKSVIKQCDLKDEVEINIKGKKIVISSSNKPREGWEAEFEKLTEAGKYNDEIIFDNIENDSDDKEWTW